MRDNKKLWIRSKLKETQKNRTDSRVLKKSMNPRPEFIRKDYKAYGKLAGKTVLVTGGDSGGN